MICITHKRAPENVALTLLKGSICSVVTYPETPPCAAKIKMSEHELAFKLE